MIRELAHTAARVRGRTPRELLVRAAQAAVTAAERRGWWRWSQMTDERFTSRVLAAQFAVHGRGAPEALLQHFQEREASRFFAAFDNRERTVSALRRNFAGIDGRARTRADAVCRGEFDLLGYRGLHFGSPIDWQLDPTSGRSAPLEHWSRIPYLDASVVGDHKVVWELNRHQHFLALGRAYWLTGDERYAETCLQHIASWSRANPPKLGINWASSLEVAFRAMSWTWALHFVRHSPALDATLLSRTLGLLHVHARHLEMHLSTYFSPNTHLTGEALGLLYIGAALPELAGAERWRALGWKILAEQLPKHVSRDGVYFERATHYQRYTADFYLHALTLAERGGWDPSPEMRSTVHSAVEHLLHMTRPDGTLPMIGDDDGGRLAPIDDAQLDDARPVLSTGAVMFGDPALAHAAGALAEETVWLLGASAAAAFTSIQPAPAAEPSRAFPEGGYYVMRNEWGPTGDHAVLDCGPHGALSCGHSHDDSLSMDLSIAGRRVLMDAGTYAYTTSASERDYFRGSAAHSGITVDGEPPSVPGGPFSWKSVTDAEPAEWESNDLFDFFEGAHNGYARLADPVMVRRSVLFLKGNYWVVRDCVLASGRHSAESHFHCAPELCVSPSADGSFMLGDSDSALLRVVPFGNHNGASTRVERGWVSRVYGQREECSHAVVRSEGTGEHDTIHLLLPEPLATRATVREIPAEGGRALEVMMDDTSDVLLFRGSGRRVTAAGITTDASWTWVRRGASHTADAFVSIGGRWLTIDGAACTAARSTLSHAIGKWARGGWNVQAAGAPDGAARRHESAEPAVAG